MPECKDIYMLLVCSQAGMNSTQVKKSRSTVHSLQRPWGQVIPFHEAGSNVDCQGKPSPALHSICALLPLRSQIENQFWVSKPQPPTLGDFPFVSAHSNVCSKTLPCCMDTAHGTSITSGRANSLRSFGHRREHQDLLWKTRGESLSIGLQRKATESKCLLRSLKQSLWLKPTQIIRHILFFLIIKLLSTLSLTCEKKRLNVEFINLLL